MKINESLVSVIVNNLKTSTKVKDQGDKVSISMSFIPSGSQIVLILKKTTIKKLKNFINSLPE